MINNQMHIFRKQIPVLGFFLACYLPNNYFSAKFVKKFTGRFTMKITYSLSLLPSATRRSYLIEEHWN